MIFKKNSGGPSGKGAGFAGRWHSTFGPLEITMTDGRARGSYRFGDIDGEIEGTVSGRRLTFKYREPAVQGEGWFDLLRPGRFSGKWRPDGSPWWYEWSGERGFDGIWNSSFGPMKLVSGDGGTVTGFYEMQGPASIEGQEDGGAMSFIYREPAVAGQGTFTLSDDGFAFSGQWRPDGQEQWQPWEGSRLLPAPGQAWLVVLEAHWQLYLQEREYSFGEMLDAFFARNPRVSVRHRFFSDGEGLRKWARGLMYIPEPVVLVVAAHGTEEGLRAGGPPIGADALVESVRYADTIMLTHFSSCLMMNQRLENDMAAGLRALNRFPVSGYTTPVNWAASAIIEFTYLNYIFEQGLPPGAAAEEVLRSLKFAGDKVHDGSPFPAAGFQIMLPESNKKGTLH
jgi:hypothetical protein